MTESQIPTKSIHVGEVLALALGFGLSTLAVFARTYTKLRLTKSFLKEDYFSVLAWVQYLLLDLEILLLLEYRTG